MVDAPLDLISLRDVILAEDFDHPPWTAREWNAVYAEGTAVTYYPVLPPGAVDPVQTRTRSEAWELGSGEPVVKVEGRTGGVALSHLVVRSKPIATTEENP